MAVITTDILLEGMRRDDVLDWLANRDNHARILEGAFDGMKVHSPGDVELTIQAPPRARTLRYTFDRVDLDHGGRRVHVTAAGRRVSGKIHYSLRTMKPSTNTLVTLHMDYDSGGALGGIVEQLGLRKRLESAWKQVLENMRREVAKG